MKQLKILALVLVAVWMAYGVTPIWAEEINIVGTGAGVSLLEALGKAFNKMNPNITVSVPKSIGSGGGIKAVGTDQAVIGRVSRGINDKEKEYQSDLSSFCKTPSCFLYSQKREDKESFTPTDLLHLRRKDCELETCGG